MRASPEQALDERAQLEQLDGAHDELEAGPIFSEGGDCTESEHEASEGTSDHEDELLKAEVDVLELKLDELDCEPIGAPESDGEDGSDEDNVEPVYAVHQLSHAAQGAYSAPACSRDRAFVYRSSRQHQPLLPHPPPTPNPSSWRQKRLE